MGWRLYGEVGGGMGDWLSLARAVASWVSRRAISSVRDCSSVVLVIEGT